MYSVNCQAACNQTCDLISMCFNVNARGDYRQDVSIHHKPPIRSLQRTLLLLCIGAFTCSCALQDHNLDIEQLMDSSPYKETYRHDMIVWSEAIRSHDPGFFCRLAVSEANSPIWLISDARRRSDMQFFEEEHGLVLLTVRVNASEEARKERGWVFNKEVDMSTSECGLDEYECQVNINNSSLPEENLTGQLDQIISWVKMLS